MFSEWVSQVFSSDVPNITKLTPCCLHIDVLHPIFRKHLFIIHVSSVLLHSVFTTSTPPGGICIASKAGQMWYLYSLLVTPVVLMMVDLCLGWICHLFTLSWHEVLLIHREGLVCLLSEPFPQRRALCIIVNLSWGTSVTAPVWLHELSPQTYS